MKELATYLTFDGDGLEAMTYYHGVLGGELLTQSFDDDAPDLPAGARGRMMHARLTSGPDVLMASDAMPGAPFVRGTDVSVCVQCETVEQQDRMWAAFADGGTPDVPLGVAFWGDRFGVVRVRRGVSWMLVAAPAGAVA